jgi:hypothetical protein
MIVSPSISKALSATITTVIALAKPYKAHI